MKLWKVNNNNNNNNNTLLPSCEQWALPQLGCLPGSSLLTHMTAKELKKKKNHIQGLGMWVLQLSEHRVATGAAPNHETSREKKANEGKNGTSRTGSEGQHRGTESSWLCVHGDTETAIKSVISVCGTCLWWSKCGICHRAPQNNERDGSVRILNKSTGENTQQFTAFSHGCSVMWCAHFHPFPLFCSL